jgi:hypothetical protein
MARAWVEQTCIRTTLDQLTMGRREVYKIGEEVERRDAGEAWRIGYVTSVSPCLKVTVRHDPKDTSYVWDEVRKMKAGNDAKTSQKAPSNNSTGRSSTSICSRSQSSTSIYSVQSNVTTTLEVSHGEGGLEHQIRKWMSDPTQVSQELQQEDAEEVFKKAEVVSAPIGVRKRDKVKVFVMRAFCCIR